MTSMHNKQPSKNQKYEEYWKLTVEYTDINKMHFRNTLEMIINYIDSNPITLEQYNSKYYQNLQSEIAKVYEKANMASIRKSINQMVKLGFVKPKLLGYHRKTKEFLRADNSEKRKLIFSEIIYSSANFQSSVSKDNSHIKHINFFLKTLMYKKNQQLNKEEIIALMSSDILAYKKGFMNEKELNSQIQFIKFNDFEKRKYNQISYFFTFLKYIPGISVTRDKTFVYYTEDANVKLADNIDVKRDPTLFRIMKEKIKEESIQIFGKIQCYFTKREQKGLVVSHIIRSEDALKNLDVETAYDFKNAVLLEPNTDAYFDKYDLTFDNEGKPIFGTNVPTLFEKEKKEYSLNNEVMCGRYIYMQEHYDKFLKKNKLNS